MTAQSFKEDVNGGDQFAFAVPISIVLGVLDSEKITNNEGEFQRITRLAFQEKSLKHCKKSLALFEEAKNAVDVDFRSSLNLKPYIDECNALITSGGSIDTKWDEWREKIKNADTSTILLIVGGGVLSIILLVAVILLVRRSRTEEKKMHTLEDALVRDHVSQSQVGGQVASALSSVPAEASNHASNPALSGQGPIVLVKIKEYAAYRQGQGARKEVIIEELRKAGWEESVIQKAVLG